MNLYAPVLDRRHAEAVKAIQSRLAVLEARTAGIDSGVPLMALPAQIDPGYTAGDPQAYINGAAALSGPYQHLASYTPAAGDQVAVLPVGTTYIVLGKLT